MGVAAHEGHGAPEGAAPERPGSWAGRVLGRELAVVLFFAVLSVAAIRPLAFAIDTHTLYGADAALYVWMVDWLSGHLASPGELFEGNIYHPTRHAVLRSDLAFGTALLVAPLRLIVHDPVTLYNLGVLLTLTFGAWGFYTLARALTGRVGAGLLAGILATYGSHQLLHMYQLALVNTGWLALFLLGLHRTLARPRAWKQAAFLGVAFALNALSSGYFAVAGVVLALVFAATHWRSLRSRGVWLACLGAAALAAILLLPYLRAFAWLQKVEGVERSFELSLDQSFQPVRDLTSGTYLYRRWRGSRGERLFPGLACLALALVGCARRARGWAFYLTSMVVLLLLSLGPEIEVGGKSLTLPYGAIFALRPFNAMMHPYTFAAVAHFCLCVLAGMGLAALVRSEKRAVVAAAVLGLAETADPGPVVRPVPAGVPPIYQALERLPPGPVLEVPLEAPDAMIWAARHGRPVINGAAGLPPPLHARLQQVIRSDWLRESREGRVPDVDHTRPMRQLLRTPALYIIVPAGRDPDQRRLQEGFERSRLFIRVAGEPGHDTLYRRLESATPEGALVPTRLATFPGLPNPGSP